jgi:hypothetical protein
MKTISLIRNNKLAYWLVFIVLFIALIKSVPYRANNVSFTGTIGCSLVNDCKLSGNVYRPPFFSDFIVTKKDGARVVLGDGDYVMMIIDGNQISIINQPNFYERILSYIPMVFLFCIIVMFIYLEMYYKNNTVSK